MSATPQELNTNSKTIDVLTSFDFSAAASARILILGSMPGQASLEQQQYYAHPRNVFWEIMQELFSTGRQLPYQQRLDILCTNQVALWDVARQCKRKGSLDSNIESDSIVANDFISLFEYCPKISTVFFNGKKAAELFQRLVIPTLSTKYQQFKYHTLPSTSPAHAALSKDDKLRQWKIIKLDK